MRIIVNTKGQFLYKEITDGFLRNRMGHVLSFTELPVSVMYPISKYAPIGRYDIFTITLEVSHEGIKTPLMIGPKTFIAPLAVPLIEDFPDYLYAIANTIEDTDRWKQYKDFQPPADNVLEKGFTFDYIEGVLPQTVFKYEKKFFENLDRIYENSMIFTSMVSSSGETIDEYYETLNNLVASLETDAFINKEKPSIEADIIYDYPKFSIPVSMNGWFVYITLGYEDYGRKIRQMFRTSLLVYAPIDFEIMLQNIDTVKKDLKKGEHIIEEAPDFYNPIKDRAKELLRTFINYYERISPVAKKARDLKIFSAKRKIKPNFDEYLQVTPEGYEIVVKCPGKCTEKDVERINSFEELIREKVTRATVLTW